MALKNKIKLYPVTEAIGLLWSENPKRGDVGQIMRSIAIHGFLSIPVFSPALPNVKGGTGAILAGNHRVQALHALWKADSSFWKEVGVERWCPTTEQDGEWLCPILTVPHLVDETQAIAAALDDNNTTLGGDFSASDRLRLWDPQTYLELLERVLLEEPNSIASEDQDNLAYYLKAIEREEEPQEEDPTPPEKTGQGRVCPHCGGEL